MAIDDIIDLLKSNGFGAQGGESVNHGCAELGERLIMSLLPPDLLRFYNCFYDLRVPHSQGQCLIIGPMNMVRARVHVFGPSCDSDGWGPTAWYGVVGLEDQGLIAIDVDTVCGSVADYIYCCDISCGINECPVVAKSFEDLLAAIVAGGLPWASMACADKAKFREWIVNPTESELESMSH